MSATQEIQVENQDREMMDFSSYDKAMQWAKLIADSDICPKAYKGKPGNVLIGVQYGKELGLKTMQSLQEVAVVNGKPTLATDAMLAFCLSKENFQFQQWWDGKIEDNSLTAFFKIIRHNQKEYIQPFSIAQAKKAGLWGKEGPWTTYPDRMLMYRAKGFALRDNFPHLLKGFISLEEARDYPVRVVDINAPKVQEVKQPISDDTYNKMMDLIEAKEVDTKEIKKWVDRAKVESMDQFSEEQGALIIQMLEKRPTTIEAEKE